MTAQPSPITVIATEVFVLLLLLVANGVFAMAEVTDVIFAVDSTPAILAVTTDPFIIHTSNVFAILGLRSLYFALAGDHLLHS